MDKGSQMQETDETNYEICSANISEEQNKRLTLNEHPQNLCRDTYHEGKFLIFLLVPTVVNLDTLIQCLFYQVRAQLTVLRLRKNFQRNLSLEAVRHHSYRFLLSGLPYCFDWQPWNLQSIHCAQKPRCLWLVRLVQCCRLWSRQNSSV